MQPIGMIATHAPLATGHPFGLPEAKGEAPKATRIQPVVDLQKKDDMQSDRHVPQLPWFGSKDDKEPVERPAPPSLMQIKITQMLNEQAREIAPQSTDIQTDAKNPDHVASGDPKAAQDDAEPAPLPLSKSTETSETSAPMEIIKAAPIPESLPAYEEAANLERNSVFSTLP